MDKWYFLAKQGFYRQINMFLRRVRDVGGSLVRIALSEDGNGLC